MGNEEQALPLIERRIERVSTSQFQTFSAFLDETFYAKEGFVLFGHMNDE